MKRDKKLLKAVIITGIVVIIGICVMIAVSRLSNHTVEWSEEGLTLNFSQQIELTDDELSEEIAKYKAEEIIGLDLSYCFEISDISWASGLSNLKSLDISYSGVEDISALADLRTCSR